MKSRWGIGGSLVGSDRYRPDIDVLRGLAVLMVVLFHVSPIRFPGGFVGVDVFFVISGYLITGLLLDEMQGEGFRLREFWWRRARRLFPALAIAVAMSLLIGVFVLDAFGLSRLGIYAVSASTFSTNVLALSEVGYFESGGVRPLLHLWSLAVEEQFYLVWPVALLLLRKRPRLRWMVAGAVLSSSLLLCAWLTPRSPDVAFFLPLTRFWEPLIGALLAMGESRISVRAGRLPAWLPRGLGALFIAVAFVALSERVAFPGWVALLPCLGAALFIVGGMGRETVVLGVGELVLRAVGLVSYPLYLYHYVLLAYLKQGTAFDARLVQAGAAVLASSMLAAGTYWWIERPIRHGRRMLQRGVLALRAPVALRRHAVIGATCLLVLGGCGAVAWRNIYRTPEGNARVDLAWVASGFGRGDLWDTRCFVTKPWQGPDLFLKDGCIAERKPNLTSVVLVGDSHAGSLAPGIRTWAAREGADLAFSQFTGGWCSLFYGERYGSSKNCVGLNELAEAIVLREAPDVVLLHMSWVGQLQAVEDLGFDREVEFREVVDRYLELGARRVAVVGPVPLFSEPLPRLLLDQVTETGEVPIRMSVGIEPGLWEVESELRAVVESRPEWADRVVYVSSIARMCEGTACIVRVGPNLRRDLVTWDQSHLTVQGAKFLGPRLMDEILRRD